MTPEQVAKILTFLTAVDSRVKAPAPPRKVNGTWIVDPTVTAWQAVLDKNRVRFEDAWEGVQELASEPMIQVPQVGHVVAAAKRHRKARLEAVPAEAFVPPDELPPGGYPKWLQAARNAVVGGHGIDAALSVADEVCGVQRRIIGAPVGRNVLELVRGERA